MANPVKQPLCVFENETLPIPLTIYDAAGELLDLTGTTIRFVVWTPPDGSQLFAKTSAVPAEILIDPDQVANKGQATVFIDPSDVANSGLFEYNVWVDLAGGAQNLVIPPSRFEILIARRA